MEKVHRIWLQVHLCVSIKKETGSVTNENYARSWAHLQEGEVMVDENCETPNRNHQKLHPETVMVAVIGGPELHVDQVDGGVCTSDVDHLVKQQIITEGPEKKVR